MCRSCIRVMTLRRRNVNCESFVELQRQVAKGAFQALTVLSEFPEGSAAAEIRWIEIPVLLRWDRRIAGKLVPAGRRRFARPGADVDALMMADMHAMSRCGR